MQLGGGGGGGVVVKKGTKEEISIYKSFYLNINSGL